MTTVTCKWSGNLDSIQPGFKGATRRGRQNSQLRSAHKWKQKKKEFRIQLRKDRDEMRAGAGVADLGIHIWTEKHGGSINSRKAARVVKFALLVWRNTP